MYNFPDSPTVNQVFENYTWDGEKWKQTSIAGYAPLASPAFTGTPTAPTAAVNTNTTQLASTAFVIGQAASAAPIMDGAAAVGAGTTFARADHVHPTDTTRYAASNPSGYQTAAQVTASLGSYLPLAGGTLTGQLNGTTGNFSTTVISTNGGFQSWGAANPAYYLCDGGGTTKAQLSWSNSTNQIGVQRTATGNSFYLDSVDDFVITGPNAYRPGGGPWTASSDARIKNIIGDYTQSLDKVVQLHPVIYTYKGNDASTAGGRSAHATVAASGKEFVGLIAQDVEPIFPGMVLKQAGFIDGVAVDDLRSLDTTPLIFALVNAVKELKARIEMLEAAP